MIINWLVFSDLHFQFSNISTKTIREKLIEFIKTEANAEFMIITGDCFYKANNKTDVTKTADYIHELISACGCGKNNVYITPGNHDLIRTELRLSTLSYYTGIDYSTGRKKVSPNPVNSEAHEALFTNQYFSKFLELHNEVVGRAYGSVHHLYENNAYRILNINTCVLSGGYYTGQNESMKNLNLDEGNLSVLDDNFFENVHQIKNDDKLNIAFMHHGETYLRENERSKFQHILEDSHIDIIFTGHSHKIGVHTYDKTKNRVQEFTCGAPIDDSYSDPSFFYCSFETTTKQLTCQLYSYSLETNNWAIANNIDRSFINGKCSFIPIRFQGKLNKKINLPSVDYNVNVNDLKHHFNEFGIIDALPLQKFMIYRNRLIQKAEGNIILAGQSLENAFDIRKDSESIVESIKNNKKITNIDVFLTDPIMFDSSTSTYEGDTPISRISSTMHTILYDIAESLNENQSINIYFIPLVQLDHMVFVNNILLIRHTLLWSNDNRYKATPLVCRKTDGAYTNESIVKSSMYNVYEEYINKLKEESIIIDIQEKGNERDKETLAKKCHKQWRERLYILRTSKKLKGKITMHKLYRTQLISDLHSSWSPRFRTFSSEINWIDESETSSFNTGFNTQIENHIDLYNPENLLNDSTQKLLLPYIRNTEKLLNNLVKKYDAKAIARIYPSLDIGIPNNVIRLAGGFATGMLIVWKCGTPIIPIDTTVNVCSSSFYQFDPAALKGTLVKDFFNEKKINSIINNGSKEEGLAFSFNTGNHFLLLCKNRKSNMYYLVLHSSAKQFKDTYLGLYPRANNWYANYIKTYKDNESNRYLRYLKDAEAERFISIARMLNKENEDIHNWFAEKFCNSIHFTRHKTYHHYGMPTDYSIAIGTYIIDEDDVVPIFSREGYPICMFRPDKGMWSIELEGKTKYIVPHGWGQKINHQYFDSLANDKELERCTFDILKESLVIKDFNGNIVKKFSLNPNNRFPEGMVEVRELWNRDDNDQDILKYGKYLSGTIEEILEPVALFSKGHDDEVKYYANKNEEPLIFS